ncbi:hypothetical protein AXF42_Ash016296 [Apostasia shenzhenica]|uniref:Uncharacterized protein n=1 Tax=Apostasia shenzhenica TaxID=1088818 RepID=A0A2H9ZXB9_9ASPA|nr:hypothetical protein AXF42_Ash016296 [Apostasia shenzhenica]
MTSRLSASKQTEPTELPLLCLGIYSINENHSEMLLACGKRSIESILFPKVKCYCTEPKLHALEEFELQSLSSDSELTEWLHLNE